MVLDLTMSMAVLALLTAIATIVGCIEDLESDVGSQSNPNSQVQLAPQMNYLHRIFNKAISGEPISNGLSAVIGGVITVVLLNAKLYPLAAIVIGALLAAIIYGIYATTSYAGRVASLTRFKQPLYMDIMRYTTPSIIGHNFIVCFGLVTLAYLQNVYLGYPFSIPFLALIWGISVGAIGSSVGDVHYGGEREFQNREFGCGLNTALSGNIVRKAESGLRSSLDNVWFCAKFGGPATGIALGLTVLFSTTDWPATVFGNTWRAIYATIIILIIMIIINRLIEIQVKNAYGPYPHHKVDTKEAGT